MTIDDATAIGQWRTADGPYLRRLADIPRPDPPESPSPQIDFAQRWLRKELRSGPRSAHELARLADRAGITRRTLARAKNRVGAKSSRRGFGPGASWIWVLNRGEGR